MVTKQEAIDSTRMRKVKHITRYLLHLAVCTIVKDISWWSQEEWDTLSASLGHGSPSEQTRKMVIQRLTQSMRRYQ